MPLATDDFADSLLIDAFYRDAAATNWASPAASLQNAASWLRTATWSECAARLTELYGHQRPVRPPDSRKPYADPRHWAFLTQWARLERLQRDLVPDTDPRRAAMPTRRVLEGSRFWTQKCVLSWTISGASGTTWYTASNILHRVDFTTRGNGSMHWFARSSVAEESR
jgi:hypothetical protein